MLETRLPTRLAKPSLLRELGQQLRVEAVHALVEGTTGPARRAA